MPAHYATGQLVCAYVGMDEMRPYFIFKDKLTPSSKKSNFIEALENVDAYIEANPSVQQMEVGFALLDDETYRRWVREKRGEDSASDYSDEVNESTIPKKVKLENPTTKKAGSFKSAVSNGSSSPKPTGFVKTDVSPMVTTTSLNNTVKPLGKKIGFIDVGDMGCILVKRLVASGHKLHICSRSIKDEDYLEECEFVETGRELLERCDIIFSCSSDHMDAKELMYNDGNGIFDGITHTKSYIELSPLNLDITLKIQMGIAKRGGRYLEASLCGSLTDAQDGNLMILCAGDQSLFEELLPCFQVIGRKAFFLGAAGNAVKVRLAQQMLNGSVVACVAETLAFADRCGLNVCDFAELLEQTSVNCPLIQDVAKRISDDIFLPPSIKLGLMQKEMQCAVSLANGPLSQPTPIAASANQLYLTAKKNGLEESDCAAIYSVFLPNSNK